MSGTTITGAVLTGKDKTMPGDRSARARLVIAVLALLLAVIAVTSLTFGASDISTATVLRE